MQAWILPSRGDGLMLSLASRHVFCLVTLFSSMMCFSRVFFLWTDRLVTFKLTRPVFHTSYICLVSLLAPASIEWTFCLP